MSMQFRCGTHTTGTWWTSIAVLLIGLALSPGWGAPPEPSLPVTVGYDANGLQTLLVGDQNMLVNGALRVTGVRVADSYRNPYEMADPYLKDTRTFSAASLEVRATRFDPQTKRLIQTFDWGSVSLNYATSPGRLDAHIEVANTSKQSIEQITLNLLTLKTPTGTQIGNNAVNLGDPTLCVLSPPVTRFIRAAFPDEKNVSILCPTCYTEEADEFLRDTKQQARVLDKVTDGVCASCQAETHLPRDPLVVAGSMQPNRPLVLQWKAPQPGACTLSLIAGDEKAPEVYDGMWVARPIKPGATETIEVSLLFGRADGNAYLVGSPIHEAFAKANPFRLRWPDRRPIGMAHLSYDRGPERNQRGWWGFKDTQDDIRTPEGKAAFNKWIMQYADQVITVAEKSGSQGVIVWDLEGKQYPWLAYYGDPRVMKYTAPEMEAMADAFFRKLRDAGLRVGVCLRPHEVYPVGVKEEEFEKYRNPDLFANLPYTESWEKFNLSSYGPQFWEYDELGQKTKTPLNDIRRSPLERLDVRIKYCKERWGATLFYVDTNYFRRPRAKSGPNAAGGYDVLERWEQKMMNPADWEELQRRHPDVLLIPEHETVQYWNSTAPYRQPPYDGPTHPAAALMYPEAFSALALNGNAEAEMSKQKPTYSAAVKRGDLIMHPAWYGPSSVVTEIYAANAIIAPLQVTLQADGSYTLNGTPYADLKALEVAVTAMVKGKPFAERRVYVQYAAKSERKNRAALIAMLEKADAVIAWSQPLK